ncbi:MAG: hypothetical protein WBD10_02720, partial [Acidobacteriaceae bacterium]
NSDVIPNEVRDLRFASDATTETGEAIPSKSEAHAEEPALPPPTPHRQKSTAQQHFEDIYYGRIPAPDDL